jgi:hypothetical protein
MKAHSALAALSISGLCACSESAPAGYRASPEAVAQAQLFRQRAEDCYRAPRSRFGHSGACTEALALHKALESTPTHFGSQEDWERFSESKAAGTNLLLKSVLSDLCDVPPTERPSPRQQAICRAADPRASIAERVQ